MVQYTTGTIEATHALHLFICIIVYSSHESVFIFYFFPKVRFSPLRGDFTPKKNFAASRCFFLTNRVQ